MDVQTNVHKRPQATGGRPQKGCQCILSPTAAFDDGRHPPLTGNFDKIDQKHHHKNEEADHHSMLEYGDNLHCIRLRVVILIKIPAGYLNKMVHN